MAANTLPNRPIQIRFSDDRWKQIERDWQTWWAGELQRPLVTIEISDPVPGAETSQLTRWGLDTPIDQLLDNRQRLLEATHWLGDAFPKWWPNFGPGTIAAFQGSRVSWTPDTTWFWPLEGVRSLADIHPRFDPDNAWWLRIREVTRRAVERWGGQVLVGISDIGGNLDVLAGLRSSEKLLLDVTEDPEQVDRLAGEITGLWARYYNELEAITRTAGRGNACWGPVWSPGRGYMLQCDFSYMISPRMFRRFVLPDLAACCELLDYGFYHMDGKGQLPHLDHLLSIARLRGIQWQPGDGQPKADGWLPVLQRIRAAGKLCQIYVTRAGALTVQRELGGKGFLMHIVDDPMSVEEANVFLTQMR
jgi:5-methyltetrahydrofolate--homocysteine methyltransferase